MAFVVVRPRGSWDIRESHTTPNGPRSRTLASFRTLTDEVLARAQRRAGKPLDLDRVRESALRAGAPVEPSAADKAAAQLIAALGEGRRPRPALRALLLDTLQDGDRAKSDNARAAAAWVGATPAQRGRALVELLMLSDALPHEKRERRRFPRIQSHRSTGAESSCARTEAKAA